MDKDELKRRTKDFALRVLRSVRALPNTVAGRAVGSQLVRCGSAVGANYRAACKSRSRAEFVAKVGVVEDKADESAFWMELIVEDGMVEGRLVQPLLDEANGLASIMGASRITAKKRLAARKEKDTTGTTKVNGGVARPQSRADKGGTP